MANKNKIDIEQSVENGIKKTIVKAIGHVYKFLGSKRQPLYFLGENSSGAKSMEEYLKSLNIFPNATDNRSYEQAVDLAKFYPGHGYEPPEGTKVEYSTGHDWKTNVSPGFIRANLKKMKITIIIEEEDESENFSSPPKTEWFDDSEVEKLI